MKARRQTRILDIVRQGIVETQEELAHRLEQEGFPVTQATVSRDIKELKLVKVPMGDGRYRYAPSGEPAVGVARERMVRLLREYVTAFDSSENIVVVSTLPGMADPVAEAIDHLQLPEVIGTLAGERVVFAVVKPKRAVAGFLTRLRDILGQA
ncbi:MAG TPA: arginine repressor [Bacillota bacterium]|nr:arginine repressor [Bacillota bacterium]